MMKEILKNIVWLLYIFLYIVDSIGVYYVR